MTCSARLRRLLESTLLISAVFLFSGCIKNKIIVKVKNDGSGNIAITRVFSKEIVSMFQAQLEEMQKHQSEDMDIELPENPFYNEKTLKREAFLFGPGVTFVEAREYSKAGARGSIALYAFKNIDDIFVNMETLFPQSQMGMAYSGMEDEPEVAEKEENAFEFKLVKGPVSKLSIICPDYPEIEPDADDETETEPDEPEDETFDSDPMAGEEKALLMAGGNPFGFTGNESETEMIHRMFKGTHVSLVVEVEGALVKSNASHQQSTKKNRCTLVELDMDEFMASPKGKRVLNPTEMSDFPSPVDFFASVRNLPGIKIEQKKEVNVEFKKKPADN